MARYNQLLGINKLNVLSINEHIHISCTVSRSLRLNEKVHVLSALDTYYTMTYIFFMEGIIYFKNIFDLFVLPIHK